MRTKILENVIDVERKAHYLAMRHARDSALVLFDFAAAFPSVSRDYMWDTLEFLGIPAQFIAVVRRFYRFCQHWLKLQDCCFKSVLVGSGVRQGCPLSPILFALAESHLLHPRGDGIRAYADDIAMLLHSCPSALR